MKQNDVSEEKRCQLICHVYESTNSKIYGNPYSTKYLLENVVPHLDFPMIDFAPMKYQPGRFRDMLPREVKIALGRKRKNREESLRLHEEAKAAQEARSLPKKRGRPPKTKQNETGSPPG